MSGPVAVAAVDLGASGGRVMAGLVGASDVALHEVHRFGNQPVAAGGTLYWDILRLLADVRHGLELAARQFPLASAGIDSWGVDYGLLDETGALLGNPVHYRDGRTEGVADRILAAVPADEIYAVTGIQQLPFNTIYQLAATPMLRHPRTMLLIPDLLAYWLTGEAGAEITNASTTSLFDVRAQAWATGLIRKAGLPPRIFPPLRRPGDVIGPVMGPNGPGSPVSLIAVGSHDTASAVAGVPAGGPDFAYISSGTWSLAGVELDAPVLTEASRAAKLHQRDRHRRHHPLPAQPDGLVAAAGEPARLAGGLARVAAGRGGTAAVAEVRDRPGRPGVPAAGGHAGPDRQLAGPTAARPARPGPPRPYAASWTAWHWPTGARSPRRSRCPGGTRTWCTSSAAGPATRCSASSRPTPPGCR
jgi:sugar (pentulose or hexulose) kinase